MKIEQSKTDSCRVLFKTLGDGMCFKVDPNQYPRDKNSVFLKIKGYNWARGGVLNAVSLDANLLAILSDTDLVTIVNAKVVIE